MYAIQLAFDTITLTPISQHAVYCDMDVVLFTNFRGSSWIIRYFSGLTGSTRECQ